MEVGIKDASDRLDVVETGATPANGSVTNAKVATSAAISADKLADGTTNKVLTATERTKLSGIATAATANSSDATLLARANHTGTQPVSSLAVTGTASSTTFLRGDGSWATPAGGGGSGQIVSGYIPSGSTTPTVTHSLGTVDLAISVHDEITTGYPVFSAVSTSINAIQFTFSAAPTANRYRYTIISNTAALSSPQVRDVPVTQAYAASLTLNATAGNSRICTATGDLTLNEPTGGADGQVLLLRVIASGAQRVVTLASAFKRPSGIASTLTIANGLRGDIGLYYEAAYGWTVRAAQVA